MKHTFRLYLCFIQYSKLFKKRSENRNNLSEIMAFIIFALLALIRLEY